MKVEYKSLCGKRYIAKQTQPNVWNIYQVVGWDKALLCENIISPIMNYSILSQAITSYLNETNKNDD